ncbi:MAG: tRNA (uridine(54)-C5)-methyltransferase TrmA [Campylobacterota bacterium]|nr:tRNA (uridine(54)-C5)-methyltransferase TrmA [Campylobacterota bacterium]
MDCKYFGICGSCNLGARTYEEQLELKINREKERFQDIYDGEYEIIKSSDGAFRNRAEFRIWKSYDKDDNVTLNYAMNDKDKKPLPIESCSIVSKDIALIMSRLLEEVSKDKDMNFKLFSVEFLSATTGDILVTLIYHRKLDESWTQKAKELEKSLNIKLIGRSRKQKVVVSKEYIEDTLTIDEQEYNFHYKEGGFTQPNQKVNEKMIQWVINSTNHEGDLCELYCGGGNFTIPLSKSYNKVLATEISKTSINSAKTNCKLNNIENIKFIRMSSEEFVEARQGVREFRRLQQEDVKLDDYNFSTIFVDPPRAGLDDTTRELCGKFDQIIYISCNPETLHRDLKELTKTHKIEKFAFFDQFAYSSHIESGVILYKS